MNKNDEGSAAYQLWHHDEDTFEEYIMLVHVSCERLIEIVQEIRKGYLWITDANGETVWKETDK